MSGQSRSGGGGGIHMSGYDGSHAGRAIVGVGGGGGTAVGGTAVGGTAVGGTSVRVGVAVDGRVAVAMAVGIDVLVATAGALVAVRTAVAIAVGAASDGTVV